MGKRSTTSTKSGKFMNPTDQARKEQRRKELKKNKKQRMAVRHAVLKGKDAQKIISDLDEIDDMELNPAKAPPLSEKVLKDKRKKLTETFDRVLKLYEREEPEYYSEFKEMYDQYHERRARKQMYFDEVKSAERVLVDEIPLPDMPLTAPLAPYDIPLPQPKSILKKAPTLADDRRRKPPGPPPGPPPALSDSEEELEADTAVEKQRSIRFQDEEKQSTTRKDRKAEADKESSVSEAKPVTPLQAAMLRMAAEKAAKSLEGGQQKTDEEEVFAEHGNVSNVTDEQPFSSQLTDMDSDSTPLPPSDIQQGLVQPIMYRGPGGAPVIGLIAPGATGLRLPGMLPPGPPPGLPPSMRVHRLPGDLPPRLVRPPINVPPPGMRPGMQQSNILSAPPSIMKPPTSRSTGHSQQDLHATISAKPIIKHHIGDVTRFTPTALKIKRNGQKKPTVKPGLSSTAAVAATRPTQGPTGITKDDAYDSFMKEIEGFI